MTLSITHPRADKNTIRLEEVDGNVLLGTTDLIVCVTQDDEPVKGEVVTLTRHLSVDGKQLNQPNVIQQETDQFGCVSFDNLQFSLSEGLAGQRAIIGHQDERVVLRFIPPDATFSEFPPRKPKIIISDDDLPVPVGPSPRAAAVPPTLAKLPKPPVPTEPDSDGVPQPIPAPNTTAPAADEQSLPKGELLRQRDIILAEIEQAFQVASQRFDTHTTDETVAALEQISKETEHAIAALRIETGTLSRVITPEPPVPDVAAVPPVRIKKHRPRFQLTGSAAQMTAVLAVMLLAVSLIFLR